MADYQGLLTDLIKKQIIMLGPNVAVSQARKVASITVSDDGQVSAISGDPHEALNSLVAQYMNLSGQIAKTTLDSLLEKYPEIKGNDGN